MRFFRVYVNTPYAGTNEEIDFEVEDDATDEEIEDEARESFFNYFNYSFEELERESK